MYNNSILVLVSSRLFYYPSIHLYLRTMATQNFWYPTFNYMLCIFNYKYIYYSMAL